MAQQNVGICGTTHGTYLKFLRSKPDMVTPRDMIELTTARPSRIISRKRALGNIFDSSIVDLRVNGSLLHNRRAGSACFAITCAIRKYQSEWVFITQPPGRCGLLCYHLCNEHTSRVNVALGYFCFIAPVLHRNIRVLLSDMKTSVNGFLFSS